MNWFERYSIPGLFFITINAVMWCIFFGIPCNNSSGNLYLFFLGAALATSVPVGYLLVITSQVLYYKISPWRIHIKPWNKIKKEKEEEELIAEAEITFFIRTKKHRLKQNKWLAEWFPKRVDVMAINSALILSIIITFLPWFIYRYTIESCTIQYNSMLFFKVLSIFLIILCYSNTLLSRQVKYIMEKFVDYND